MGIERYWAVIVKWLWLIIVGTIVAGGVAYFLSQRMEPVYQATATLMVRQEQNPASIVSPYYSQPLTFTYVQLIRKRSVMEGVISELDLAYTPGELVKKIKVSTIANTNLLELSAEDTNPLLAQHIANTTAGVFSQQYQQQILTETTSALSVIDSEIAELEEKRQLSSEEQNRLSELYTLRTLWRIQLTQAQATGGIIPWESASLPTSPVRPNILQNVLLACLLGLVVTGGSAFLIEYLNRAVRTTEDVSRLTGLPTLGVIMNFKTKSFKTKEGKRTRLVAKARPRSSMAESFRVVRTNLQFVTQDKPNQTLLVSSSVPEEGKSIFTANLAVSIAEIGKRVILVDADLRHGSMHKLFDLPNKPGFSNLFVEDMPDVASLICSTEVEGLKVLPRGSHTPNPSELFSSPRLDSMISELRKEADVVLFDSSPILVAADTTILAPKLDGVILLVEAGKMRPEALTEAKEALSKGNANILGVVLNKVKVSGAGGYYYRYRYPYYHQYYTEKGKEEGG